MSFHGTDIVRAVVLNVLISDMAAISLVMEVHTRERLEKHIKSCDSWHKLCLKLDDNEFATPEDRRYNALLN